MADRRNRMAKEWNGSLGSTVPFTANGTKVLGSLGFGVPGTVIRTLWEYVILATSSATIVADDQARVCMAIGIVSSDAVALGDTAMPDPADEPNYPWLYWRDHLLRYRIVGAQNDSSGIPGSARVTIDSKSMRKIKPRESLVLVAQYVDVTGTPNLTVSSGVARVLFAT